MNTIKFLTLAVLFIGFTSCSSDDDNGTPQQQVESETVSNLYAPQNGGQGQGEISGEFTKFNFSQGTTTTSETDWDIAFRGTTIIVNGGTSLGTIDEPVRNGQAAGYIAESNFADVVSVNTELLAQDSEEGYVLSGWYTYNPQFHIINPTPGRILVIKTHDGKYAKMEITSYYEDSTPNAEIAPTNYQYYNFNYVYQPNEGVATF